ncbi:MULTISPECIES: bifunctional tetrahydrofolate synthase/dihydrofolate synthase [Dyella]|uniref:Dihydrofolate synthase/folylpolyglutamate synthase n=2 Tax=Dyella TaxID=231454 RepID=A0A4R0Z2B5_9GAMM|nr:MULTISPECIES: bifunctional tetrahydrofolate synthase/dihydrofolate synthase [Dyella]TBR39086.1 bifunctional tetrahydrofolate synthase/dihydrofolate synthase [Dyella terrae]TCI13326.1 bifunctional tetrahydrofolate synthase/dihydrofolate synthase [Dyella soli]
MSRTLAEWLSFQERVNVRSIELGLDRVRTVWQRMGAPVLARHVITVGGTNGKGSTVALLEAILRAGGARTGCYTSPHLLRYNERIRIDGVDADDAALVASFERIEAARGDLPLTYFEFGTLAALDVFAREPLDVAVLEVGLGGRLDAVNIIDADVAVVTTVDLDHMDWLGPDRDVIGREKAGIARAGRPVIVGDMSPPQGLLDALALAAARVERAGIDFQVEPGADGWRWIHRDGTRLDLPQPSLAAPVQIANAATAIAALHALGEAGPLDIQQLHVAARQALPRVRVPARLQSLGGDPEVIVDVGHNPQAASALAQWFEAQGLAPVHAVYGALADKDVDGVMRAVGAHVAKWHLAGLDGDTPRGLPASALAERLGANLPGAEFATYTDVATALDAARGQAGAGARILAFGSFFVAAAALAESNR